MSDELTGIAPPVSQRARPILKLKLPEPQARAVAQAAVPRAATPPQRQAPAPKRVPAPRPPFDPFSAIQWRNGRPAMLCGGFRPLALGLGPQIIAEAAEGYEKPIKEAIRRLVRSWQYLEASAAEGAQRHDLQGDPVGPVSDEHRASAMERLAEMKARQKERKKQGAAN